MNKYQFILIFILNSFVVFSNSSRIWEIALPGNVVSIPVERKNNEVVLICEDRRVYSINAETGDILWNLKPGGRLRNLQISFDGSITVVDDYTLFSIFGNGEIKWSHTFNEKIDKNYVISEKGDIYLISGNSIFLVNRFGVSKKLFTNVAAELIEILSNSLILTYKDFSIDAMTIDGEIAWSYSITKKPSIIKEHLNEIYIIYSDGLVDSISLSGENIKKYITNNPNPTEISRNYLDQFLIYGDGGITLFNNGISNTYKSNGYGLYYSNGILIEFDDNWNLYGVKTNTDSILFPSGRNQLYTRNISLSDKRVWNDEILKDYYLNIIFNGNRSQQLNLLKDIEKDILEIDLLVKHPNFYEILLIACSPLNKNQDVRLEAYRLIGKSRDISFLPYLVNNLIVEKSYIIITNIFYALGLIGIDLNGSVINLINSRVDDFYDEKFAVNALYALYNINYNTNGEYVEFVFSGIEKILNSGYSKKIENECYSVIKNIK
ncbi:MAG: hypothetical protein JXR64_10010 [Spirochaetales bacterium]|nr:hypothetical protein [Spirochaetales bacterium]